MTEQPPKPSNPNGAEQPEIFTAKLPDGMTAEEAHALAKAFMEGKIQTVLPDGMSQEEAMALVSAIVPPQAAAQDAQSQAAALDPGASQAIHAPVQARQDFNKTKDTVLETVAKQKAHLQKAIQAEKFAAGDEPIRFDPATLSAAVEALDDVDPKMVALANALASMSADPSVYNSMLMVEVIKQVKALIRAEALKAVQEALRAKGTA